MQQAQEADSAPWLNFNSGDIVVRQKPASCKISLDPELKVDHYEMTGEPATVEYNSRGSRLYGRSVSFDVKQQAASVFVLSSADVTGDARVTTDTAIEAEYARSIGKPIEIPIASRSDLRTDSLTVRTIATVQTLTLPTSFVFRASREARSPSRDAPVPFDESDLIEGAGGTLNTALAQATGTYQIATGSIDGPVHYHMERTERPPGEKAFKRNTYDLMADRIVFDFSKPEGSVSAIGHVRYSLTGDRNLQSRADRVDMFTDADHKVSKLIAYSSKTTIPAKEVHP
jgi:hypothetical protein